jgi:hypothetical protein
VVAVGGGLMLLPSVGSAMENGPGVRLGAEVAACSRPVQYRFDAAAPGTGVSIDLRARDESLDFGGRVDAGWILDFSPRRKIALFPHLALTYMPLRTSHVDLSSASTDYALATNGHWMSIGLAPEIQFAGRTVILAPEVGAAWVDSRVTVRGGGVAAAKDRSWGRLWVRLAAGGRWPLGSSVAAGALLAGELTVPSFVDDPAAFRAVLTVFVEMDGSRW